MTNDSQSLGEVVDTTAGLEAPILGLASESDGAAADSFSYLREIAAIPLLSRDEHVELAASLREATQEFRERVLSVPTAGALAVARWRGIRDAGRVTGTLSAGYRDGSGRDYSSQVDAGLSRAEQILARREKKTGGRSAAAGRHRAAVDDELRASLESAGLSTDVIQQVFEELRSLRGQRRSAEPARRTLVRMLALKNRFVQHNLRLVVSVAKEFRNMGVEFVDLIQEANIGLVRAVEKFDERKGFTFSTYAVWWLRQACVRAVQQHSRTVRLPSNVYDLILHYRRARTELERRLGRDPLAEELAQEMERDLETVEKLVRWSRREKSTEAPIPGSDTLRLEDTLADSSLESPVGGIDREEIRDQLPAMLEALSGRERRIVEVYYGLGDGDGSTLDQIGAELGLSRERVRQIKVQALEKLREGAEQRGLRASLDPTESLVDPG